MEPPPDRARRGALRLFPLGAVAVLAASCAAPAPEAAAPAPRPAPGERAYIVFFDWGSSRIGPRGREVIAEAARNASGAEGTGRVELQAFADRSGRSNRNQSLSERRAAAVVDELVRQGRAARAHRRASLRREPPLRADTGRRARGAEPGRLDRAAVRAALRRPPV